MRDNIRIFGLAIVALVLVAAVALAMGAGGAQAAGEPQPGTVVAVKSYTFYPTTASVVTDTHYLTAGGLARQVGYYNSIDVFFEVDVDASSAITLTPQFSPDGSLWADAYHTDVLSGTVTNTDYSLVFNTDADDQTGYLSIPIAGEYFRVKAEQANSAAPKVVITLRNN